MPGWDTYTEIQGTDVAAEDLLPLSDQSQTDGSRQRVVSRSGLSFALGKFPISETAHGLSVGDAFRFNGTNYVEATADTSSNAEMIGLVVEVPDADTFYGQQVGFVTGLSGLTPGSLYYLQDAGGLGATPGTVGVPVLVARAATTGWLTIERQRGPSEQQLIEWTEGEDYEATSATFDSDGVVTTATIKWPDGSAGTFTTDTKNSTWLAVDAYNITHTDSGLTVTQTAVTRDSDGAVTTKPALTVA